MFYSAFVWECTDVCKHSFLECSCGRIHRYAAAPLEYVGHSYAYVAQYVVLRDVWIRTQRAAVASRRATNLATHLPLLRHPPPIGKMGSKYRTHRKPKIFKNIYLMKNSKAKKTSNFFIMYSYIQLSLRLCL